MDKCKLCFSCKEYCWLWTHQAGGILSSNTSEKVGLNSSGLWYSSSIDNDGKFLQYNISNACGISVNQSYFVITGGIFTRNKATAYNQTGFIKDLPNMHYEREGHGCTSYKDNAKNNVNKLSYIISSIFSFCRFLLCLVDQ